MKYIKGKNLENLCQEQPEQRFSVDTALTMMTPIVEALIYLHQQEPPIVHRNVNPANIVVPPDETEAILVGFGPTKEHSATGAAVAFRHESLGYAAIEQFGQESGIDLRTDVYGLGATFYTLLTGVIPIDAISRVTMEQGSDPLKPISAWVPTIPLPVTSAVERAMSLHKKDRFATIEEFWQATRADANEQDESPSAEISPLSLVIDQVAESGVAEPLPVQPEEDEPLLPQILPLSLVDHAAESEVANPLSVQPEDDELLPPQPSPLPTMVDHAAESEIANPLPMQFEPEESPSLSWEKPPLSPVVDQAAENEVAELSPVQPKEDESLLLEVPLFATTVDQAAENVVAEALPVQHEPKPKRKRSKVRSLSLALMLLLGLGLSCFVYVVGTASYASPAHKPTAALSPSPTGVANTSSYPSLASSYAGTVSNISVPKTTTKLYLRGMQQDQDGLQGSFEGLGMAGPFTGTVTPAGKVLFKVKVHSSSTMLIFDGSVASSGTLEGTFNAVDQHGRNIGKYGLWYASVSSTLQDSSPAPANQNQTIVAVGGQYPVNKNNAHPKVAAQPNHVHRKAEPPDSVAQPTPAVGNAQPPNASAQPTPTAGNAPAQPTPTAGNPKLPCKLNLVLLCL